MHDTRTIEIVAGGEVICRTVFSAAEELCGIPGAGWRLMLGVKVSERKREMLLLGKTSGVQAAISVLPEVLDELRYAQKKAMTTSKREFRAQLQQVPNGEFAPRRRVTRQASQERVVLRILCEKASL